MEPPEKKLKVKYDQTWKDEYSSFTGIVKSDQGLTLAFCKLCNKHFSIKASGKYDINKRCKTQTHIAAKNAAEGSSMYSFCNSNLSVIKAEVVFTKFLIEKNIPLAVADDAGDLFGAMFPKDNNAKQYKCGTKTTAIVHTLAAHEKAEIIRKVKSSPVFSVSTDGGNDTKEKLFPIIVRFPDFEKEKVVDEVLSVDSLGTVTASGVDIFNHVKKVMEDNNLDVTKCLSLSVDNAAVMVGEKTGVAGQLHNLNDKVHIIGCPCYRINLAALKAANALPYKLDQLLINVYFFLDKSSKRVARLKEFQNILGTETHEILKHASTRWLSLGPCVSRLLEQWEPLSALFLELSKEEDSRTTKEKAQNILHKLLSDEVKAYACFIENVIPTFENANAKLQENKPLIHKVLSIMKSIIHDLCLRFRTPLAVKTSDGTTIDVHEIGNILKNDEIDVGSKCKRLVNEMTTNDKKRFYKSVVNYLQTAVMYFQKNSKLDNKAIVHSTVADPQLRLKSSITSLQYFKDNFPSLLPIGMSEDDAMDRISKEFRQWQASDHDLLKDESIDSYWFRLGKLETQRGEQQFSALSRIMVGIVSQFHSNAACERLFSLIRRNRTDFRKSMSNKQLESIAICKNSWGSKKSFTDPIPKELLTKAKSETAAALAASKSD